MVAGLLLNREVGKQNLKPTSMILNNGEELFSSTPADLSCNGTEIFQTQNHVK